MATQELGRFRRADFLRYQTAIPHHFNTHQGGCSLFQHHFSHKNVNLQIRVLETKKKGAKERQLGKSVRYLQVWRYFTPVYSGDTELSL